MNKKAIIDIVMSNIDWVIVFLVIAGGYFAGLYLQGPLFAKKNPGWDKTLKALLMGTFFTLCYLTILYLKGSFTNDVWGKMFLSYVVATSFYDIILRPFNEAVMLGLTKLHNWISSFLGGSKKDLPK